MLLSVSSDIQNEKELFINKGENLLKVILRFQKPHLKLYLITIALTFSCALGVSHYSGICGRNIEYQYGVPGTDFRNFGTALGKYKNRMGYYQYPIRA